MPLMLESSPSVITLLIKDAFSQHYEVEYTIVHLDHMMTSWEPFDLEHCFIIYWNWLKLFNATYRIVP